MEKYLKYCKNQTTKYRLYITFFDLLKNETKAKKILNNINLEELIQSIEESLPSKSCR